GPVDSPPTRDPGGQGRQFSNAHPGQQQLAVREPGGQLPPPVASSTGQQEQPRWLTLPQRPPVSPGEPAARRGSRRSQGPVGWLSQLPDAIRAPSRRRERYRDGRGHHTRGVAYGGDQRLLAANLRCKTVRGARHVPCSPSETSEPGRRRASRSSIRAGSCSQGAVGRPVLQLRTTHVLPGPELRHDFDQPHDIVVELVKVLGRDPVLPMNPTTDLVDLVAVEEGSTHLERRYRTKSRCSYVPIACDLLRILKVEDRIEDRLLWQAWREPEEPALEDELQLFGPNRSIEVDGVVGHCT